MKLKIKCNGTPETVQIVNAETDEPVENIMGIDIAINAFEVETALFIKDVEIDMDNIEVTEIVKSDTTGNDREAGSPDH
jgi:hypothetical protein